MRTACIATTNAEFDLGAYLFFSDEYLVGEKDETLIFTIGKHSIFETP